MNPYLLWGCRAGVLFACTTVIWYEVIIYKQECVVSFCCSLSFHHVIDINISFAFLQPTTTYYSEVNTCVLLPPFSPSYFMFQSSLQQIQIVLKNVLKTLHQRQFTDSSGSLSYRSVLTSFIYFYLFCSWKSFSDNIQHRRMEDRSHQMYITDTFPKMCKSLMI